MIRLSYNLFKIYITSDSLSIELYVYKMRLGVFWGEAHQAPASPHHSHMVRHLTLVDGDLQLTLSGLTCIHYNKKFMYYNLQH